MPPRVINGRDEFLALEGQHVGTSEWIEVTQDRIQTFADATGDQQWIHIDPERAKTESPYGTTIAHGFLTLSLCPHLSADIFQVEGVRMGVNYGLNRVRFPNAVRVGDRVRMSSELLSIKPIQDAVQAIYKHTFEIEGQEKPACVAETVVRLFF